MYDGSHSLHIACGAVRLVLELGGQEDLMLEILSLRHGGLSRGGRRRDRLEVAQVPPESVVARQSYPVGDVPRHQYRTGYDWVLSIGSTVERNRRTADVECWDFYSRELLKLVGGPNPDEPIT